MHKLTILFETDIPGFQAGWQEFMALAEQIPGLRQEIISRPERLVAGGIGLPGLVHDLVFDSRESLEQGLASPQGNAAGQFLQSFTGGRVTLFTAEHLEATPESFKKPGRGKSRNGRA